MAAVKVSPFNTMKYLNSSNYFEMFGLAPCFAIDMQGLELSYRRLQSELHPDRYASKNEDERHMALANSTTVNDGYRALRSSASRAQCLISLAGWEKSNVALSSAFLMAQMEWREAIEEARASMDAAALEALGRRLKHRVVQHERELASALDERSDFDAAARYVNEFKFYEKLRDEIDDALIGLDH